MIALANLGSWLSRHAHLSADGEALVLSWQALAAMTTISSMIVAAGMAYLRAYFGAQLTKTEANISRQIRSDVREAIQPVERRVERLEDAGN